MQQIVFVVTADSPNDHLIGTYISGAHGIAGLPTVDSIDAVNNKLVLGMRPGCTMTFDTKVAASYRYRETSPTDCLVYAQLVITQNFSRFLNELHLGEQQVHLQQIQQTPRNQSPQPTAANFPLFQLLPEEIKLIIFEHMGEPRRILLGTLDSRTNPDGLYYIYPLQGSLSYGSDL